MGLYWGLSTAQGSGSKVHPKYILRKALDCEVSSKLKQANTVSLPFKHPESPIPLNEEYTLNYEGLHIMIEAILQNEIL